MKVLFDHQAFCLQPFGGISRYFAELMNSLMAIGSVEPSLSLLIGSNHHLAQIVHPKPRFTSPWELTFYGRSVVLETINRPTAIAALRHQSFDVFHPTYYSPYFLSRLGAKPFVLTIFDMIHELYEKPDDPTVAMKRGLARKAARIIAISEQTKRDIVSILGIAEEKITVISLANSIKPVSNAGVGMNLPPRYILYVGNRCSYKNFWFFTESISRLLASSSDLHLICAGSHEFKREEQRRFNDLRIGTNVHHYPGDDRSLAGLYQNALGLVLPSLYEGFGLPILEAFACGCPVAASNTGSLPEVADKAAIYFSPADKEQLLESVRSIIEDTSLRDRLRLLGYKRATMFSWEQTAKKTAEVYMAASR